MVSDTVCHLAGETQSYFPLTLFSILPQEEDKHEERAVLGHAQRYKTLHVTIKEVKTSCVLLVNFLCN